MPYISAEDVKKIRNRLKEVYPECKFSVIKDRDISVRVHLLESPFNFEGYGTMWANDYDENSPECWFVHQLIGIINNVHPRKEESYDGDYGSIPNYYLTLMIGKYKEPHIKREFVK